MKINFDAIVTNESITLFLIWLEFHFKDAVFLYQQYLKEDFEESMFSDNTKIKNRDLLTKSFMWIHTKKGYMYWLTINREWIKFLDENDKV